MKVAWLKKWTYTHDAYLNMWWQWQYFEQNSNLDTINFLRANRWIWILPKVNVYWGPVEEVMSNIWKLKWAKMLWYYPLKIHHVLASRWEISEIEEIKAHPQALMQCADWLEELWWNASWLFNESYKTPEIFETSEIVLEIGDTTWSLAKCLEIFFRNWINLQYLHSTPYARNKYRFYILISDLDLKKINSKTFLDELNEIWWKILFNNNMKQNRWKIKLTKTKTNVDWIIDAQNNPKIWVICSEKIAKNSWLNIVKNPFCAEDNETHFSLISTQNNDSIDKFKWVITDKVMALLTLPDKVWILFHSLNIIKNHWLSLSFIMSLWNNYWGYDFPLVIDNSTELISAQIEISRLWWNLRVL